MIPFIILLLITIIMQHTYIKGYQLHYRSEILVKGWIYPQRVSSRIGYSLNNLESVLWKNVLNG